VCFYLGASLLGALDSLGPRAVWILLWNRKQKRFRARLFGTSIFKLLGPDVFWRPWALWAPTLKQGTKNVWAQLDGASLFKFWGPRVFWGTWAL
jgi:hypothetical protein